MTEPVIRPARKDDIQAIREISRISWEGQGSAWVLEQQFGPLDNKPWFDHFIPSIQQKFDDHLDWIWVTECEGRVAGFASCTIHEKLSLGTLGYNAVHPDFRGKKLGKAQVEFLMDHFRALKLEFVDVFVTLNDGHRAARSLYAAQGCETETIVEILAAPLSTSQVPCPGDVRPARPEDASAIRSLLSDALQAYHPYAVAETSAGKPLGGHGWLDRLSDETDTETMIVTERNRTVVGAATLAPSSGDLASMPLNIATTSDMANILAGQIGFAVREFTARGARVIKTLGWSDSEKSPLGDVCRACGLADVTIYTEYRFGPACKPVLTTG
jgi:ribosomal protein S18 acetylase RimI-like enzyme